MPITKRFVNIIRQRATHSGRLERWLGRAQVERLSLAMQNWYGPPIAVGGVPGAVWAHKGGDFRGPIRSGQVCHAMDYMLHRMVRAWRRAAVVQQFQFNAGFSSLSDLISEYTAGKEYEFQYNKAGSTGVVGGTNSLWRAGPQPAAGAAGSAAPGGRAPADSTTGGFPYTNPTGGDTLHFLRADPLANFVGTVLLYDRIFDVAKTMSSSATESVTGVPTRYQSSTPSAMDYAGGNFIFIETFAALGATAHNWTVCLYRNQAGTDAQTMPSLTGNASAIIDRLDHPLQQWFAPLATGDFGAMDLNQMQCSAVVTGSINFVIGHPIAWWPIPIAQMLIPIDGLRSAFNLVRIFDDACLSMLEVLKPATNATTYTGTFSAVAG